MAKLKRAGNTCSGCQDKGDKIAALLEAGQGLIEATGHFTWCSYLLGRVCNCDMATRIGESRRQWNISVGKVTSAK